MKNQAALFQEVGGPNVFKITDIGEPQNPGPDQVLIRHTAIGVNYIDAYYRSGLYKLKNFPFVPGIEAVGVIEAVGENVTIKLGTRVAYALANSGAYCHKRVIESKKLVPVPDDISDATAAACLLKGMTAHMLIYRVFRLQRSDTVLVHNATDGTGHILCQWIKQIGATIIGTVDHPEKIAVAKRYGCDHVANYKTDDVVQLVRKVTKGEGVTIVYDGVGKDTFGISIQSLMPMGFYVSYDQSSGQIPGINILSLATKSLYLSRPSVQYYKSNTIEMALTANEIFERIRKGQITPTIGATYSLSDAAAAHADLAEQKTIGSIILKP